MKLEYKIYGGVGVFFILILIVYFFWSGDGGNSVLLLASGLLGILPGLYIGWWSQRMEPRPEDRNDADLRDGSGAIGAFPSHTIWPFVLGMGAFMIGLALVFGVWLAVVGGGFVLAAVINATFESKRGGII